MAFHITDTAQIENFELIYYDYDIYAGKTSYTKNVFFIQSMQSFSSILPCVSAFENVCLHRHTTQMAV